MCWMAHVNGNINNRDLATSKLLNPEAFFSFMYTMHHLKIDPDIASSPLLFIPILFINGMLASILL